MENLSQDTPMRIPSDCNKYEQQSILIYDACAAKKGEYNNAALIAFQRKCGKVCTTVEVIEKFRR